MEKVISCASLHSKDHLWGRPSETGGLLARDEGQPTSGDRSCLQLCEAGHHLHSSNHKPLTECKEEGWNGQVSCTYTYSTLYTWLDGIKPSWRLSIKILLQSLCVILTHKCLWTVVKWTSTQFVITLLCWNSFSPEIEMAMLLMLAVTIISTGIEFIEQV